MAIIDELGTFTRGAFIGGPAGVRALGLAIDLGAQVCQAGESLKWTVLVKDNAMSSTGGKCRFHLCSDSSLAIATDGTATYHFSSGWFTGVSWAANGTRLGDLYAGARIVCVSLPSGNFEPYLGVLVEVSGGLSGGSVKSFITSDSAAWRA